MSALDTTTNEDMMKLLREMKEEMKTQIISLERELGKVEVQSLKLVNYEKNFEAIQQENSKQLTDQLDDLKQYSRLKSLGINGIPAEKN